MEYLSSPGVDKKNTSASENVVDIIFRNSRPASLLSPPPQPKKTFTETCVIVGYKFDVKQCAYVLNLVTRYHFPLNLIPNPYYTDETTEPWKLERNYKWNITYSGDEESYGQIQTMTRGAWLHPKFFKNFSFL